MAPLYKNRETHIIIAVNRRKRLCGYQAEGDVPIYGAHVNILRKAATKMGHLSALHVIEGVQAESG